MVFFRAFIGLVLVSHIQSFSPSHSISNSPLGALSPCLRFQICSSRRIPSTRRTAYANGLGKSRGLIESSFRKPTEGSNFISEDKSRGADFLEEFEADVRKVVKEIRAGDDNTLYPKSYADVKSRMSISYVWNLQMWRKHTSRLRYWRHISGMLSSKLMKRIFPLVSVFLCWAVMYVYLIANWLSPVRRDLVPLTSLSLVSTFVGFLLTLRSNQGLSRLGEGRELWGRAFIVTRDTAQLLATYVYPKDKRLGVTSARYLAIFAWLLKGRLRGTDDSDIIDVMLPSATDRNYLISQRKKPAACIARIRQVVASLAARNVMPVAAHQQLEGNLYEMNYILGMCERLWGSPIPPVYTSHTSRLLVFYLFFLPVALHGARIENTVNILVTVTVAFAMLGLDEISHLLEQPFQLMPIHELSRNMMMDVADAFVCQPPLLKSKTELLEEEEFLYPYDENNTSPEYW